MIEQLNDLKEDIKTLYFHAVSDKNTEKYVQINNLYTSIVTNIDKLTNIAKQLEKEKETTL